MFLLQTLNLSWSAIGVLMAIISGVIAVWIIITKTTTSIDYLKEMYKSLEKRYNDHEKSNEITFTKIQTDMKSDFQKVYDKLDKILDKIYENKKE